MKPTIAVLGGDLRQVYLARLLEAGGRDIVTWGLEKGGAPRAVPLHQALEAQVLILPLPVCRGGALNLPLTDTRLEMEDLWPRLRAEQLLLGGMTGDLAARLREDFGLTLLDYYDREELQVANAVPTALAVGHRGMSAGQENFGRAWIVKMRPQWYSLYDSTGQELPSCGATAVPERRSLRQISGSSGKASPLFPTSWS